MATNSLVGLPLGLSHSEDILSDFLDTLEDVIMQVKQDYFLVATEAKEAFLGKCDWLLECCVALEEYMPERHTDIQAFTASTCALLESMEGSLLDEIQHPVQGRP